MSAGLYILEPLVRFAAILLGLMPMQTLNLSSAVCTEAVRGREVIEELLATAENGLPDKGEGFTLTSFSYDPYNATVYYVGSHKELIGVSTIMRDCRNSEEPWSQVFNEEWFDELLDNYDIEATRRCSNEDISLIEFDATYGSDDVPYVIRYYFDDETPVKTATALLVYPVTEMKRLDNLLEDSGVTLLTCEQ